ENDLIDSYARGDLQGPGRLQFEARFLATPELRRRVQFAQALAGYGQTAVPERQSHGWRNLVAGSTLGLARRFALAGVVLGLLVFSVWIAVGSLQLRRQLEHMNAEQARLQQLQQDALRQIADLNAQLQKLPPANGTQELADSGPPGQPMISLTLSPGVPRGSAKATILPISSDVSNVRLLLKTGGGLYSRYGVSVETPEGQQIFKKNGLKVLNTNRGKVVAVSLPARALPRGDYILRLVGTKASSQTEDIDAYSFRVVLH
ncbi:MAG TPA: hypothetical protein VI685_17780, partial [Candidatus Angelobacter sp.]